MRKFTADFETTTDPNDCRVWAYAICEIGDPDNFQYGNSIDDFMDWCAGKENYLVLFHNLKFDGDFILNWLLKNDFEYIQDKKDRKDHSFTTLITDMGAFYAIEVYFSVKGHKTNKVTFHDSLKLLNFSVDEIAKSFDLPIHKLELDYTAKREVGHELTEHEVDYIRNDVEIMARALDILYQRDMTKMTVGANALDSFKKMCSGFKNYFPELPIDVDADIRKSYKGGFTYLSPKYKESETGAGLVLDINSMYPAMMCQRELPYGLPEPFEGKYEYDSFYPLYVQKFSCVFKVKPDRIPSIQLKNHMSFIPNEYLESSNGEIVNMTLTNPDFELFLEQYDVDIISYDGGWKFKKTKGLFTGYINYWTQEKIKAKKEGNRPQYLLSKLMLNNLYGKLATNPVGRQKMPVLDNIGKTAYEFLPTEERKPLYIPAATFITSYARKYIIETSQMIRDWSKKFKGKDCYVYSDTDSIHCLLDDEDLLDIAKYIKIDPYELGAWDCESHFTRGKYLRQKCYIEEIDGEIHSTIAGLPKKLAPLITFDNFRIGFTTEELDPKEIAKYGSKLRYKHVEGGVVLIPTDFTIK